MVLPSAKEPSKIPESGINLVSFPVKCGTESPKENHYPLEFPCLAGSCVTSPKFDIIVE